MPLYMIAPDQGGCPDGHPCHESPASPAMRTCDVPEHFSGVYVGIALLDVYAGPVGVEAYQEACAALRSLMADHEESEHHGAPDSRCPGIEVCPTIGAGWLRTIQDVIDPLPRGVAS